MPISSIFRTIVPRAAALVLACALPAVVSAQQVPAERMRAFLRAASEAGPDSAAMYFPRRGDWTWVQTARRDTGDGPAREPAPVLHRGVWRFPPAATLEAIDEGGPVCGLFEGPSGDVGPVDGNFGGFGYEGERAWRRVGRNRFVPPGASARSAVFVEWRREDGAWVVSSLGDEVYLQPRVLGSVRGEAVRDAVPGQPLPPGPAFAARETWFVDNEPMTFDGFRYVKYGLPRKLDDHEITRIGRRESVPLYAEAGLKARIPDYIYVPVAEGEYQPYQGFGKLPCNMFPPRSERIATSPR